MTTAERFVSTQPVKDAVRGEESRVLLALGIQWNGGKKHIRCPYPHHSDENPSWRWDGARAHCTCSRADDIFDIAQKMRGGDFESTKLFVATAIGKDDLVQTKGAHFFSAEKLLAPPPELRAINLGRRYLAYRLGVPPSEVLRPSTPVVGWTALKYYDPPANGEGKPALVGEWPCVVFGTTRIDGCEHAHRIYVADNGAGKASLGSRPDGYKRDAKKSAVAGGKNTGGCAVLWGNVQSAPHIILTEGIETGAAIALAFKEKVECGETAVAAAITAGGVEAFQPHPATKRVTVAADRDENRPPSDAGYRRGEQAARRFAEKHVSSIEVGVTLPGNPGTSVDWLDVLLGDGVAAVAAGVTNAKQYAPSDFGSSEGPKADGNDAWSDPDLSIFDGGLRPPPLPLDVFGPVWGDWIAAHAENVSSPADYVAAPLLVVAAAVLGNTRGVSPWPGWVEPCILWICKVGKPSSNKSPSDDPALGLVRRLEADLALNFSEVQREHEARALAAKYEREAWEAEVKAAVEKGLIPPALPDKAEAPDKPVRPRLKISDATPEALGVLLAAHPKGLLFHRDELAGWLGNFDRYGGGGERPFWAESFNGRDFVIDRKKHSTPIRIPYLSISCAGGIQPERLVSLLLTGDDDGLAARFLMVWPDPLPPRRPIRTADDSTAYLALRRMLALKMGTDQEGSPIRVSIPFTQEAAEAFQQWREDHHAEDPPPGMFASHCGKLPGLVLRLALVLEYLWWAVGEGPPPEQVSIRAFDAAAGLVTDYFFPMACRAYSDAALPSDERGGRTIARWIIKTRIRTFNAGELRRNVKLAGLRLAPEIREALVYLEEAGLVRHLPARKGETTGRQRSDYAVNPRLLELVL